MDRRRISWAFSLVLGLFPLAAGADPLAVVTTTEDLAAIVRGVGGNDVQVRSITRGHQDPHHVDAKPSHMTVLRNADLLIYVGMDLEVGWLPLLIEGARNPNIRTGRPGHLDASSVVQVLDRPTGEIDRSQGDVHPSGNPHYWLNPHNSLAIANEVEQRLLAIRPEIRPSIQERSIAYRTKLQAAIDGWKKRTAPLKGVRFVAYHATFRYLADWLGLAIAGHIEERPGIPPSPRHVARLIALMKNKPVVGILSTRYDPRTIVARVGDQTGAKPLFLPTSVGAVAGIETYEDLIEHLVVALLGAIK